MDSSPSARQPYGTPSATLLPPRAATGPSGRFHRQNPWCVSRLRVYFSSSSRSEYYEDFNVTSLNLDSAILSGYAELLNIGSFKAPISKLTFRLGEGRRERIRVKRPQAKDGERWGSAVPYTNSNEEFRIWHVQAGTDLEIASPIGASSTWRSGAEVKSHLPNLFAFAQSLGHWKDV